MRFTAWTVIRGILPQWWKLVWAWSWHEEVGEERYKIVQDNLELLDQASPDVLSQGAQHFAVLGASESPGVCKQFWAAALKGIYLMHNKSFKPLSASLAPSAVDLLPWHGSRVQVPLSPLSPQQGTSPLSRAFVQAIVPAQDALPSPYGLNLNDISSISLFLTPSHSRNICWAALPGSRPGPAAHGELWSCWGSHGRQQESNDHTLVLRWEKWDLDWKWECTWVNPEISKKAMRLESRGGKLGIDLTVLGVWWCWGGLRFWICCEGSQLVFHVC